jgi:ATP-dependent RNA helicase SUPV3L1/SUV3
VKKTSLYLWLSYKLPDIFVDVDYANSMRVKVNKYCEESLKLKLKDSIRKPGFSRNKNNNSNDNNRNSYQKRRKKYPEEEKNNETRNRRRNSRNKPEYKKLHKIDKNNK